MPIKVIGGIQANGGAGWSTVSTNLAGELCKQGNTVLIYCDLPQGTSARWYAVRNQPGKAPPSRSTEQSTANRPHCINPSLKDSTEQLASDDFFQTNRGNLVNRRFIHAVHRRDELVELENKDSKTRPMVSTANHHLFRAM